MTTPQRSPRRSSRTGVIRRTFWRVYLHGVAQLVVVGVILGLLALLLGDSPGWRTTAERLAAYVAGQLEPTLDDPAALTVRLEQLARAFHVEPAVYRDDGRLVASVGDSPPPPEVATPHELDIRHEGRAIRYVVPLQASHAGTYLVVRAPPPHGARTVALVLVVVLGVVALGSLPLARTITRPLERLTAAVRRFGRGDRTARSGLVRNDEVGALAAAFDDMADRIDRLLQRDRELLANVSHELKTPLARLRVALELCELDPEADAATQPDANGERDAAARLAELGARLHGMNGDLAELERLVEDVMLMARLDVPAGDPAAGVLLRLQRVSLSEVLDDSRARFVRHHPEHHVVLQVGASEPALQADRSLLRRLFDNLLDNAAKYAEPNAGPIEIDVGRQDDRLTAEVRDRGTGVAAADLPRLFEPFFRAERSRARGTGGSGIGLAFCARIVRAHGGDIEARLRPGGGLVVSVRLPIDGAGTS